MTIDQDHAFAPTAARSATPYILAMRPKQWMKNVLVFAALVFSANLFDLGLILEVSLAFVCFCMASSAVYLLNDLRDREEDRHHPVKQFRPIAAGQVAPEHAMVMSAVLALVALGAGLYIAPAFAGVLAGYMLLNISYSMYLKHFVIVDVFSISTGFVLRAAGGAVVLGVPISPWLYVCTIVLSLFIGFGKRRSELVLLEDDAGSHRKNLDEYSAPLLDQYIVVTAGATVMAYSLYTVVAPNLPSNHLMMATIPFVLYGIFRYLFLVHQRQEGGAPEQLILTDRPLLGSVFLWGMTSIVILYGPWT
ncbi:MAG: decaprenyl-phosphate phosphoribosyltransferase [Chloroflexia bacterium]|jgi:4-hydroxybenzoate polyprenyltransferase|nr:decaprenyl-phosphate phosphoribosyltransferase [Chloroflexia bacterium]